MATRSVEMPHRLANSLAVLVMGSTKIGNPARTLIQTELNQVSKITTLKPPTRRQLFQLIHAMRAFDSSLTSVARYHLCTPNPPSMGKYLGEFAKLSSIPFTASDRRYYQKRLVDRRNALMHEAGNYPAGAQEVINLISRR